MQVFGIVFEGKVLKCAYVTSEEKAKKCVAKLLRTKSNYFGLDLETAKAEGFEKDPSAGLCPYRSTIRLVQVYDGVDTIFIFDVWKMSLEVFRNLLVSKRFVAHNAIFDLMHLRHNGFKVGLCDCTILLANLVHHAEDVKGSHLPSSLAALVTKEFGVNIAKHLQTSNWNAEDLSQEQLQYAGLDTYLTVELANKYIPKIKKHNMQKVYTLNRKAQKAVVDMQLRGMRVHKERHLEMIRKWETETDAAYSKVEKLFEGINIRSSKQMTEWLDSNIGEEDLIEWPKTGTGKFYKTDADTLQDFKHLEFIQPLCDYKYYDKLLSTYGKSLHKKINPVTGRLHGGFTLCRTHTGRLSSREPNCQNYPLGEKGYEFKHVFIPDKGNIFLCADYSQIELRIMGEISKDSTILKAYRKGVDLHKLMAAALSSKSIKEVTKESRQLAKAVNFGLIYGMGAKKLKRYAKNSWGLDISEEQAMDYVEMFHTLYAGYAKWKKKTTKEGELQLLTTTPVGKVRRLNDKNFYSCSLNTPVQGGGAEVMLYALVSLHEAYEKELPEASIVNCVHDELLVELPRDKDKIELAAKLMKREMKRAFRTVFPKATLKNLIEVKLGTTWQKCK